MHTNGYRIGIVGATGAVGAVLLELLAQRGLPVSALRLFSSPRSAGQVRSFNQRSVKVEALEGASFTGLDMVFFSAESVSRRYAPLFVKGGALVIDNSSAFRLEDNVPLVVPEVNPLAAARHKGVISNPNCSTIQLMVALHPLQQAAGLKRVVVSTYQAVSGTGHKAVEELFNQSEAVIEAREYAPQVYPHPIAFNCLPHAGSFLEDGYTSEEHKLIHESRKILELPDLKVSPTVVRVPVFNSHSEAVNVELAAPLTAQEAVALWEGAPGIEVIDDPSSNLYPLALQATGQDPVYVGRIRRDPTVPHGLNFWVVADNLRKGAALNAVQIAELVHREGWVTRETAGLRASG